MSDGIHFLDANIPMYAVGADHPLKQPCLAILQEVAEGQMIAVTDVEVLQEILHRYTALGERARAVEVAHLFSRVVPEALPITKEDFLLATELHLQHVTLQARDALHAAVMRRHSITLIVTADRHFDGTPGITRIDPANWERAIGSESRQSPAEIAAAIHERLAQSGRTFSDSAELIREDRER